ncbi:hypothetical protein [Singulisphaera sp. PoT]|uniref:hypothetical protein n=1 Tax=Singulisphaera sp. PoT TaxID=3411797 RepID=UPI003BF5DE61
MSGRIFLPVRWGARRYLIAPDDLQTFCQAILTGKEPRSSVFGDFLLVGQDVNVTGLPDLPEPWVRYLRENLVTGTVVEVSSDGRFLLNLGLADGIQVGDVFNPRVRDYDRFPQLVVVYSSYDTSELRFIGVSEDYSLTPDEAEAFVGWQLVMSRTSKPLAIP